MVFRVLYLCERVLEGAARFCLYTRVALTPLPQLRQGFSEAWNDFLPDQRDIGSGLAAWEQPIADRYVKPHDWMLVIGCGSGRDLVWFVERGCVVAGVDQAPRALARAADYLKARSLGATLNCAFFEDWACSEVFDVVWFSWFVYGYVPDSRRRETGAAGFCPELFAEPIVVLRLVAARDETTSRTARASRVTSVDANP